MGDGTVKNGNSNNQMGKWGATSYVLGTIIGSGIFITPTTIYANVHSVGVSLLIWLLTAILSLIGAFCYIELGTGIQRSGAEFTYLCHVNWHSLAFASMLCSVLLIAPGSMAVKMDALGQYLFQALHLDLCDERWNFWAPKLIGICIAMALLYMNCFSLGSIAAPFQMTISGAKVGTGILIILIGFWVLFIKDQTQNVAQPFVGTVMDANSLVIAVLAGIYSYGGWDALNYGTEDVKERRRAFPFAVLSGMAIVTALYLGMNLAYFVVLSPNEFEQSKAVAISFAHKTMGPLAFVMPLLIAIVLIGSINATYFGSSRFLWAAAREGHVPAFINCLNTEHDSPRAALCIQFLLSIILSFMGNLDQLISYVSYAHLLTRTFTIAALVKMRLQKNQQNDQRIWSINGKKPSRQIHADVIESPLAVPIFFLAICIFISLFTLYYSFQVAASSLLSLSIGLTLYAIFLSRYGIQRSIVYRRIAHRLNDRLCKISQILLDGKIELE